MKKLVIFILVMILGIITYNVVSSYLNRPERFIEKISATAEVCC